MFLIKISVIIICHCMATITCQINIINSETFQYLRIRNDFDFKNLVIFHDDPNGKIWVQDFFEESLWNNLHVSVVFLYYRKDFASQLAKALQQSSGSLIILDDFNFLREAYNLCRRHLGTSVNSAQGTVRDTRTHRSDPMYTWVR